MVNFMDLRYRLGTRIMMGMDCGSNEVVCFEMVGDVIRSCKDGIKYKFVIDKIDTSVIDKMIDVLEK